MSQSTARAARKANGKVEDIAIERPQTVDLGPLPLLEASLIHAMCVNGTFQAAEAKMAAASLQSKLEQLLPRE